MKNYPREFGDDLKAEDPRLKYKWDWCRAASGIPKKTRDTWTHFQTSKANLNQWTLEVSQWGSGESLYYQSSFTYCGEPIYIDNKLESATRLEAQIKAEQLLEEWIIAEHIRITKEPQ